MSARESRARRHALAARSRARERGLSLVELLLATSLMILISVFLLGGLSTARHAFQQERHARVVEDVDDTARSVSRLLEIAYPVVSEQDRKHPVVLFDGRQDAMSFIALGDGRSLRGGLHSIEIRRVGNALVADVTPTRDGANVVDRHLTRRVVLRQRVGTVRFAYYGSTRAGDRPAWRDDWIQADIQPLLASIEIGDAASGGTATAVSTLRQR